MTAVIKAENVRVHPAQRQVLARTTGNVSAVDAHSLLDELADARQRIALLEADLQEAAERLPKREGEAFERGQSEGERKAQMAIVDDSAKCLALIERSLVEAHAAFVASLEDRGRLALDLAAAALNKVLGSAEDYDEVLRRSIAHQVRMLSAETLVCASVSSKDFATDQAMAGLRERLPDHIRGKILTLPDLPKGACLIQLESGEVDAGLRTLLTMLARALEGLRG